MNVLLGNPDAKRFICPWCAAAFHVRALLLEHWLAFPECYANRNVSNPTRGKYRELSRPEDPQPGAETLAQTRGHGPRCYEMVEIEPNAYQRRLTCGWPEEHA